MRKHFEHYLIDVITGKQKGFLASSMKVVLWLLSWPFRFVVACKNWAFDHGWVCRYTPPVPIVISIGNIVVGGTGKTPATMLIAQEFYPDVPIAILSRGYRSQAEKLAMPIVLSKGNGPMQSASFCGDEPFLISQNFPKAVVVVGKNRHKASDIAARAGAQLILLDDGMQHRRLARDFEIVIMDVLDPFGQGHFLPRGLLRESIKSLSRADLIILNHTSDSDVFAKMKNLVSCYTDALIVGSCIEVVSLEALSGPPISSLKGKSVGIFCGIAHPEYFDRTICEQGGTVVDSMLGADHMGFEPAALVEFAKQCQDKGAELLICTEKDKVKLSSIPETVLPIAWLKMRLNIVEGKEEWESFIKEIKEHLPKN